MLSPAGRRYTRGAALLEFHIVALLALVPLCLGTLQIALLMIENHHIDHAMFMAARHGAVMHGDTAAMRRAFAKAITPLFVDSSVPLDGENITSKVTAAYGRALADSAEYSQLHILTPDSAAQADFGLRRGNGRVIPNDSLEYRTTEQGRRSGVSLQEANMLRIEIRYCRPLIVPFARQLLLSTLRVIDHDAWNRRCYAAGRVPIRSDGIAPMQSDFRVSS